MELLSHFHVGSRGQLALPKIEAKTFLNDAEVFQEFADPSGQLLDHFAAFWVAFGRSEKFESLWVHL
jgi:hypothetical protein